MLWWARPLHTCVSNNFIVSKNPPHFEWKMNDGIVTHCFEYIPSDLNVGRQFRGCHRINWSTHFCVLKLLFSWSKRCFFFCIFLLYLQTVVLYESNKMILNWMVHVNCSASDMLSHACSENESFQLNSFADNPIPFQHKLWMDHI